MRPDTKPGKVSPYPAYPSIFVAFPKVRLQLLARGRSHACVLTAAPRRPEGGQP